MKKLIWGAAMAGVLTMTGCASTLDGESPATTATEPSNPANVVENASSDLVNSQFLNNQGEKIDGNACFTGGSYSLCAIIKNVAKNWNAEGQLEGFALVWDQQLKPTPPYVVTSGEAWGSSDPGRSVGDVYTDPPAMGVGRLRIESTGAGAVGMFELKPADTALDDAIATSSISAWGAVPIWKVNRTGCQFTEYLGCFISDVFGGSYVWQPNSYVDDTDSFPCDSGLCQTTKGSVGAVKSRHPQVNFTAITAPVAITVTNNSRSVWEYEGVVAKSNFVLSKIAPNPQEGLELEVGEATTFYGYRSLTDGQSSIELSFITKDGARITTKTNLASKDGVNAKPSCEVQSGGNIGKIYNCDASNPDAKIKGNSGTVDSQAVRVTYSVRS